MERRGIPAATVAVRQLATTVGVAMAAAHGVPDYPIAMVTGDADVASTVDGAYTEALGGTAGVRRLARTVAGIWLAGTAYEAPTDHEEG